MTNRSRCDLTKVWWLDVISASISTTRKLLRLVTMKQRNESQMVLMIW